MKKLLTLVSAVAMTASVANADMGNGFHTAVKVGYSATNMKIKTATRGAVATTAKDKLGSGFIGGLHLGYTHTMANKLMLGLSVGYNHDTGKTKAGTMTVGGANPAQFSYSPRGNIDVTVRLGRMFNEKMSGYLGLGNQFGFGKFRYGSVKKDNARTFSLVPHIGVMGKLQEKMSWVGEVGYKFATSLNGMDSQFKPFLDKKPRGFQAKVGVAYHF